MPFCALLIVASNPNEDLSTFVPRCLYVGPAIWKPIWGEGAGRYGCCLHLHASVTSIYEQWCMTEPNVNAGLVRRLWQGQQIEHAVCFAGQRGGALQTFRPVRGVQPPGTLLRRAAGAETAEGEASLPQLFLRARDGMNWVAYISLCGGEGASLKIKILVRLWHRKNSQQRTTVCRRQTFRDLVINLDSQAERSMHRRDQHILADIPYLALPQPWLRRIRDVAFHSSFTSQAKI